MAVSTRGSEEESHKAIKETVEIVLGGNRRVDEGHALFIFEQNRKTE